MIIITSDWSVKAAKVFFFFFLLVPFVLNFQSNVMVMVMYSGYVRTLLCLLRPKFLWFLLRRKSSFKMRKTFF